MKTRAARPAPAHRVRGGAGRVRRHARRHPRGPEGRHGDHLQRQPRPREGRPRGAAAARHAPRPSSWTWPRRSTRRPCTCKSLTDPAGLRILEQNYEYDLLSSDKLLEKYVGQHGPPLPGRRHLPRGEAPVAPPGRCSRSTARSTSATPAGSCCPRCPRTSSPSHARLAAAQPDGGGAAGRGLVPHRRDHVEGRLRDGDQRRRHARRPHGLGDHRQQERRHLRQRRAQARGGRRQPRPRLAPRAAA